MHDLNSVKPKMPLGGSDQIQYQRCPSSNNSIIELEERRETKKVKSKTRCGREVHRVAEMLLNQIHGKRGTLVLVLFFGHLLASMHHAGIGIC
jgi:hypothetical protein